MESKKRPLETPAPGPRKIPSLLGDGQTRPLALEGSAAGEASARHDTPMGEAAASRRCSKCKSSRKGADHCARMGHALERDDAGAQELVESAPDGAKEPADVGVYLKACARCKASRKGINYCIRMGHAPQSEHGDGDEEDLPDVGRVRNHEGAGAHKNRMCEHNRQRYYCMECRGAGSCPHKNRKDACQECAGVGTEGTWWCEHNRRQYYCRECGGAGSCPHKNNKRDCQECMAWTLTCRHNRVRTGCKECSPGIVCRHFQ